VQKYKSEITDETARLTIVLTKKELQKLKKIAEKEMRSVSFMARSAINKLIAESGTNK